MHDPHRGRFRSQKQFSAVHVWQSELARPRELVRLPASVVGNRDGGAVDLVLESDPVAMAATFGRDLFADSTADIYGRSGNDQIRVKA